MSEAPARYGQGFRVRPFETDALGRLAPAALCTFLQEAAARHANALGAGMGLLLDQGLAWMLARLRVEVHRWPTGQDEIVVTTWPTRSGGAVAERSFVVADAAGLELARAGSSWAVVDLDTRRAVRLPEFVRRLPVRGAGAVSSGAVPEIPKGAPRLGEARLQVGRADLDLVGHANNARYVEWALAAVPVDWSTAHELATFDVAFRKEARHGDTLTSRVFLLEEGRLGHELALVPSAGVLATLHTVWRSRG